MFKALLLLAAVAAVAAVAVVAAPAAPASASASGLAYPVAYIPALSLAGWEFTVSELNCAATHCPATEYRVGVLVRGLCGKVLMRIL